MEQRILGSIGEIGLFSHLAGTASAVPAPHEKVIRARLLLNEAVDPHAGDTAWKGIVIGASMFILSAFIPLEYDYAAHVTLELERRDGQIKRYESQSAGTVRYQSSVRRHAHHNRRIERPCHAILPHRSDTAAGAGHCILFRQQRADHRTRHSHGVRQGALLRILIFTPERHSCLCSGGAVAADSYRI